MFFSEIQDSRRFRIRKDALTEVNELEANSIWAVYDYRPGASVFMAPVGAENGKEVFVSEPKYFFKDEIEQIV